MAGIAGTFGIGYKVWEEKGCLVEVLASGNFIKVWSSKSGRWCWYCFCPDSRERREQGIVVKAIAINIIRKTAVGECYVYIVYSPVRINGSK